MPRQIFLLSLNKLLISTSFQERLSNRAPSLLLLEVWARSRPFQQISESEKQLTGNVREHVDQELGFDPCWSGAETRRPELTAPRPPIGTQCIPTRICRSQNVSSERCIRPRSDHSAYVTTFWWWRSAIIGNVFSIFGVQSRGERHGSLETCLGM